MSSTSTARAKPRGGRLERGRSLPAGRPLGSSLREYGRGIAGGLLFSLPLLYTYEVWAAGSVLSPVRLAGALAATFGLLLGYNRYAGIRKDSTPFEVVCESIEELGIGLLLSACLLWLIGQVGPETQPSAIVGRIVTEGMAVAIGVSIGTAQLGARDDDAGYDEQPARDKPPDIAHQTALALCGAVIVALNIAPTDEIPEIAAAVDSWRLLGLVLLSLALGTGILFFTNFVGTARRREPLGLRAIGSGAALTYVTALAASAGLLWFFGRFDGRDLLFCLAQMVVLGLAATLGASAGRLLLQ